MPDEKRTLKASCICGDCAHEITLARAEFPIKADMCHCDSCRHMTGSLCLTVAFLPASYKPAQSLVDKLAGFQFSKRITQYFCPTCGCHMLARCLKDGDDPNSEVTWDVASGTLEHIDDVLEWQGHEHVQDTLDGGFADLLLNVHGKELGRWPSHFGKGKELPVYWKSASPIEGQAASTDKLHGYCKCGGVDFYIARPSLRSAMAEKAWPNLASNDAISNADIPSEEETYWLCDDRTKFAAGLCSCDSCRLAF